ncbi:MAG: ATP-binding protein, partial [Gemmata sp.]
PEPGWVRFTAADTGTGMSAEAKARVFERGFTTKESGAGQGLANVYGIVQRLGGRIRFFSEPGRGTTFEIDLLAARPAPALPPWSRSGPAPAAGSAPAPPPAVVLLAVGEPEARARFCHELEGAGLTVVTSGTGAGALRLVAEHGGPLDLLVTDVVLPGGSGRELAEHVRARFPAAKVLFTSDEPARPAGPEERVEYLHTPCLPHHLLERVSQLLGCAVG